MKMGGKSYAAWANIVLIPVKQHFVCCGVLPVAVSAFGGAAAAEFLHTAPAELAMGIIVPPVVTYGVMLVEQKIHDRRAKKNAQESACALPETACGCSHRTLTRQNFLKQTALGYAFYAAAHFLLPHQHDHGHNHGHDHDHHGDCQHEHVHSMTPHQCDVEDEKVIHFGKKPELSLR